jgi:hypothetical protein
MRKAICSVSCHELTMLAQDAGMAKPFIMGHSLGGLVLLSAPLCFEPGSCRFQPPVEIEQSLIAQLRAPPAPA